MSNLPILSWPMKKHRAEKAHGFQNLMDGLICCDNGDNYLLGHFPLSFCHLRERERPAFVPKVSAVQKSWLCRKKLQCHPKTTAVELLFPDTHHQLCCGERGVTRPRGMMAAIGRSIEMTSDAHLHVNTARLEMTGPFGELESPTVLVSGPSLRGFNWAKICRTIGLSLGFTVKNIVDEKALKCLNFQCKMWS